MKGGSRNKKRTEPHICRVTVKTIRTWVDLREKFKDDGSLEPECTMRL